MKKINWKVGIAAFICSIILGIGLSLLSVYAIGIESVGWAFWIGLIVFTYLLYRTSIIRKIIGFMFIGLAIESFLLPIAIFIFSAVYTAKAATEAGAFAGIGAMIGGGIALIITGILGFFFGIVMLIIGYFILRSARKQETAKKKK